MKDYVEKYSKFIFIVTLTIMLNGCSIISGIGSGIYNTLAWGPKKLWSKTGDKVFGVHNEQQTNLGPHRRPAGNPPVSGFNNMMPSPMQNPNMQNPYPQMPNSYGMQNKMQPGMIPNMPQGMAPNMPMMPNNQYQQQVVPPVGNGMNMQQNYPMPPANMQQQNAYPTQNMPPPIPMPYGGAGGINPPGMSADDAYDRAGMPMQPEKKKKSWIPFFSGNYKVNMVYEPMAAEFEIAEDELNDQDIEDFKHTRRSKSMFPLEEYAPKTDIKIQSHAKSKQNSKYPKLGRVPHGQNSNIDVEKAQAELDRLLKESKIAQDKKAKIHGLSIDIPHTGRDALPVDIEKQLNQNIKLPQNTGRKSDAEVMKTVPNITNAKQLEVKKEQKPGFFARLFGSTKQQEQKYPRVIHRKSLPPANIQKTQNKQEKFLKNMNLIEPAAGPSRPIPAAQMRYNNNQVAKRSANKAKHLPESRYLKRRRVLQIDE